jgi:hypothetical protein
MCSPGLQNTSFDTLALVSMNASDFSGKTVLDVGAGSGMCALQFCIIVASNNLRILSFFARIAGAAHVYSVEGSDVAEDMKVSDSHPLPQLFCTLSFCSSSCSLEPITNNLKYHHQQEIPSQRLVESNGWSSSIHVLHSRVEQLQLPVPHVDILISEPMGTLLFNERMVSAPSA